MTPHKAALTVLIGVVLIEPLLAEEPVFFSDVNLKRGQGIARFYIVYYIDPNLANRFPGNPLEVERVK